MIRIDEVAFEAVSVELSMRDRFATDALDKFDFTTLELSTHALVMLLPFTAEPPSTFDALIVESLTNEAMIVAFVTSLTLLTLALFNTAPSDIPTVSLMLESAITNPVVPKDARFCI